MKALRSLFRVAVDLPQAVAEAVEAVALLREVEVVLFCSGWLLFGERPAESVRALVEAWADAERRAGEVSS